MNVEKLEKLLQLMQMFHRIGVKLLPTDGLNRSELMMLKTTKTLGSSNEQVTISQLSEHLSISKPAVSQVVNSLEEKDLVKRITTRADRRVVFIQITSNGESMLKKNIEAVQLSLSNIIKQMGEHDTDEFIRLMEKMLRVANSTDSHKSD
ncbi:MAG: MarR family transcriptional regulator [Eubacteriales bacterium]|nr:MarR family transcriptional regulator [Eubacteriales bacterium]